MNVFLTGGTGLIGSAVVVELLANDHSVLALARSEASALALKSAGAEPVRGDLVDLDALRSGDRGVRRRDPPRIQSRLQQSRRHRSGSR